MEENSIDYWSDLDKYISIYKLSDTEYQQYIEDENGNVLIIGIPLKTVGDLMRRYNSLTGYELKYWDKDFPQTAQ